MQTVSKLAHREEYKSANTSLHGRDGTVQRILCNYLHSVASEEVRKSYNKSKLCRPYIIKKSEPYSPYLRIIMGCWFYARFTHGSSALHKIAFRLWHFFQPQRRRRLSMPSVPPGWCIHSPRTAAWETLTTAAAMTPESDRQVCSLELIKYQ